MSRAASYRRCLEAGLSVTETARECGVTVTTVCLWARRNGVKFPDGRKTPEFAAMMRERHRQMGRRISSAAKSAKRLLQSLSEDQRADYRTLRKAGYSLDETIAALGLQEPAE